MNSDRLDQIAIVGASLAGLRAAKTLRSEGYAGELLIIGEEPNAPYDRPPLTKKFLTHDLAESDIRLRVDDLKAEWLLGERANVLDTDAQTIRTSSGETVSYDSLIIATGSTARRLPEFPVSDPSVHELRTVQDALSLRESLAVQPRVAIVGSGFIGVELASACKDMGCESVTLIAPEPPLASLGKIVSTAVQRLCAMSGIHVRRNKSAHSLGTEAGMSGVFLDDGTHVIADVIIIAAGAVPSTSWLAQTKLDIDDGIRCDQDGFVKNVSNVLAVGDVASWETSGSGKPLRIEHWTNAVEQGALAARNLIHKQASRTQAARVPSIWSDHFGTRVQALGSPGISDNAKIVQGSLDTMKFVAEHYRGNSLVGVVGYDSPATVAGYRTVITKANEAAI